MRRDRVKKVSKLLTGSLRARDLEQLTISGLARHGLSWRIVQNLVEKFLGHHQLRAVFAADGRRSAMGESVNLVEFPAQQSEELLVRGRDLQEVWQAWTRDSCLFGRHVGNPLKGKGKCEGKGKNGNGVWALWQSRSQKGRLSSQKTRRARDAENSVTWELRVGFRQHTR